MLETGTQEAQTVRQSKEEELKEIKIKMVKITVVTTHEFIFCKCIITQIIKICFLIYSSNQLANSTRIITTPILLLVTCKILTTL